jgi:hypothetical protein
MQRGIHADVDLTASSAMAQGEASKKPNVVKKSDDKQGKLLSVSLDDALFLTDFLCIALRHFATAYHLPLCLNMPRAL